MMVMLNMFALRHVTRCNYAGLANSLIYPRNRHAKYLTSSHLGVRVERINESTLER
jgi:hypothetical protein